MKSSHLPLTKREDVNSALSPTDRKDLFDELTANGVIVDWREPAVIRMAPVPLYNSFEDIARFALILQDSLN